MLKTLLIISFVFMGLQGAKLVSAKEMRKATMNSTAKLEKKILSSEYGRIAYNGIIKLFNKEISKVATTGYYNEYTPSPRNQKINNLLSPLSQFEQDVIRSLIIKQLEKNKYQITYNRFWDNPERFTISISW